MNVAYVIREGLNGFRRAKLATVGSVITIVISLLFLGFFYVLSVNTARVINDLRAKVEMDVFLDEPVSQQAIDNLQAQIKGLDGVDHLQFISKEEAAKIFENEFGEKINSVLDFNPLPPSFKVYLKEEYRTAARADEIQKKVLSLKGIDKVVYRRDLLEFIEKQSQTFNLIGIAVGLLVAASAIFLVSNTIRLMIENKRKAIYAMKLVGATRRFVRAPFLFEGFLQGAAAGCIATALLYYALSFAGNFLTQELIPFFRADVSFYIYVLCGGVILGTFGSAISVHRYLRD